MAVTIDSALIVSGSEKSAGVFTEILSEASISQTTAVKSCGEARRLLIEREFDLVIINSPLRDESGEVLARDIAVKGIAQVILVVSNENFEEVSASCENDGVLTIAKPFSRSVFWPVLKLATATQNRLNRMNAENSKLKQKIEDIKIIDRAKCMLISYRQMDEAQAHRYIEKLSMDMRISRRAVAEDILSTYGE